MKLQRRVKIIAKILIMPSLQNFYIKTKNPRNLKISSWAHRSQKNSKNSNLYSECAHILLISPQSLKLNISTAPELKLLSFHYPSHRMTESRNKSSKYKFYILNNSR